MIPIIKITEREYADEYAKNAIRMREIRVFGILVYSFIYSTSDSSIVKRLTIENKINIKGFNNTDKDETKD